METNDKKASKGLQYYSRAIHRVLGFLTLGMVMVYALSGILLIHRGSDFMKRSVAVELILKPGLDAEQLAPALKMKSLKVIDETEQTVFFADGQYDKQTGKASYLKKEVVAPFDKFISLHKLAGKQSPAIGIFTTIFGISLFLLALTSLFMFKTRAKQFKKNMVYMGIGVTVVLLLLLFA